MARKQRNGDAVLSLAEKHLGEAYVLGSRAPMANAKWDGPWDCAEFVSWCVYQATGVLYGTQPLDSPVMADAYTGYWADQVRADGATVQVETAARVPGAILVRAALGPVLGHIAICDGEGQTVEAHSTKRGVIRGAVSGRRWDFGVLVPGISYLMNEQPVIVEPAPAMLRVTQPLMRGELVSKVQRALIKKKFKPGKADGIYGPQTAHAVRDFQSRRDLVADGEVGALTLKALGIKK